MTLNKPNICNKNIPEKITKKIRTLLSLLILTVSCGDFDDPCPQGIFREELNDINTASCYTADPDNVKRPIPPWFREEYDYINNVESWFSDATGICRYISYPPKNEQMITKKVEIYLKNLNIISYHKICHEKKQICCSVRGKIVPVK